MDEGARRAIKLLIKGAWGLYNQGRFGEARATGHKAREAAQKLGDLGLEIRAASEEAGALELLGDSVAALTLYSWILGISQDPARCSELERTGVEKNVAGAHIQWVETARFLPEMETAKLLAVLDAGEAYVRGIGKPSWRAGLLTERAQVLEALGKLEAAISAAEEGLALIERDESGPGATLASHRRALGDLLYKADRYSDAARLYAAVLADERSYPGDRKPAHEGFARCHLATRDLAVARWHADEAVHFAEGMGNYALSTALDVLIQVCLAQKDLAAARSAADRAIECAHRAGGTNPLYIALRNAAKVALAENDAARARRLLAEALPCAEAIDRSRGLNDFRDEVARFRAKADQFDKEGG